jgi:signal transducing adaptor molecule
VRPIPHPARTVYQSRPSARNVIAALLKRLTHRNANVQLYALALGDSLSKNCGIHVHREMASKAFTQSLEKIIADRVRPFGNLVILEIG